MSRVGLSPTPGEDGRGAEEECAPQAAQVSTLVLTSAATTSPSAPGPPELRRSPGPGYTSPRRCTRCAGYKLLLHLKFGFYFFYGKGMSLKLLFPPIYLSDSDFDKYFQTVYIDFQMKTGFLGKPTNLSIYN